VPPQFTDWRCGERDALEHANARRRCGRAGEQARVGLDRLRDDRAQAAGDHKSRSDRDTCCGDAAVL